MNSGFFFLLLFIVLILGVGIGAGMRLLKRLRVLKEILIRAENLLKVSDKDASIIFSQSDGLRQPWKRYISTFIPVGDGQPKTEQFASDFFKVTDILESHVNLRLYLALPNILVGIGVLGTFIGLVAGIGGFETESVDGVRESIAQLLAGMSTAFYTSIFGMLGSILFNFFEKTQVKTISYQVHRLTNQLDEQYLLTFNDRRQIEKTKRKKELGLQARITGQVLSDLFALKSKEGAVVKPSYIFGALRSEAKEQTLALKTFAEALAKVMGETQSSMDQMKGEQIAGQQGMREMVEAAKQVLITGVELTKKMKVTGEQMDERIERLNSNLGLMDGASGSLKKSGESLEFVTLTFQEEFQVLRKVQQQQVQLLIEALQKTQELSEGYAAQFDSIQSTLKSIFAEIEKGLTEHRKETGKAMDSSAESLSNRMKEATSSLNKAVAALSKEVKESAERREKKRSTPVVRR